MSLQQAGWGSREAGVGGVRGLVEGGCDKLPRVSRKSPPQVGQRDSKRDNQGRFDPLCASPKVGQMRQSAVATPSRRCAPSHLSCWPTPFTALRGGGGCAHLRPSTHSNFTSSPDFRPPSKGCRDVKLQHLHLVTGYTPSLPPTPNSCLQSHPHFNHCDSSKAHFSLSIAQL